MGKDKKKSKKLIKNNAIKVKHNLENNTTIENLFNSKIIDIEPSQMYLPKKYYTAKITNDKLSKYLDKGDIIIIDPSSKEVRESGLYLFEFRGHILARQFQLLPWGKDGDKTPYYHSIASYSNDEYYPKDEVNILGGIISKYTPLFHGLHNIPIHQRND